MSAVGPWTNSLCNFSMLIYETTEPPAASHTKLKWCFLQLGWLSSGFEFVAIHVRSSLGFRFVVTHFYIVVASQKEHSFGFPVVLKQWLLRDFEWNISGWSASVEDISWSKFGCGSFGRAAMLQLYCLTMLGFKVSGRRMLGLHSCFSRFFSAAFSWTAVVDFYMLDTFPERACNAKADSFNDDSPQSSEHDRSHDYFRGSTILIVLIYYLA